jgi:ligand-binding SRPBCC domain-containing protein
MYCIKYTQKLPISLEKSWDFFAEPSNLQVISPQHLRFETMNEEGNCKMFAGQIICHRIRPILHIPLNWVTEITHVDAPYFFVDEQRFGPFRFWHHQHIFKELDHGVEMTDIVYYKMPLGIVGKAIHSIKVKKDLHDIFRYRADSLERIFGKYS